jgi:chemotaxis protein MotA
VDKASLGGIFLAVGGILAGLLLEGGNLGQILQPTAAMIVFGGTIGAVLVQFPLPVILASGKGLARVFFERKVNIEGVIKEIVGYANKARKEGIISLDRDLEKITDPFLKKSLMLAIDGTEPQELKKMMELELENQAEHEEKIPQVFESAGGFSPTIGIIGAVLGLIQVMQRLDNIEEVGKGIAVAFVATVYGVGAANLFFLPSAGKLKIRVREEQLIREMMLEGVISILEGLNPRMVETKLKGFLADQREKAKVSAKTSVKEPVAS